MVADPQRSTTMRTAGEEFAMAPEQLLGQTDALRMRGAGRYGAWIDRKQIAPGRQHIAAPAMRRARGPGRDAPAR